MQASTYIFGHKFPDTDSVCASISLSYLKNKLGDKTEPRVLGTLNRESKFVLDYFGFKEPEFLNDVKIQIRNMQYNKEAMIEEHVSIYRTYKALGSMGITGFPLVDKDKYLTGYVNVKQISKYLIEGDFNYIYTSYDNILEALTGKELLRFDDEIEGNILAAAYKSQTFIDRVILDKKDILILGDRYKIMEYAVDSGIKLIILVNNTEFPDNLIERAKKNKVNVISVPLGTYKCSNMIKLCNYVKLLNMNPTPITFRVGDYRDDFIDISGKCGCTNYPIVTSKNLCLGMIRVVDVNDYEKKKVILVDHNEAAQSVDGLEESSILEIIDHHNIGSIGTSMPINFRCMPVGSTCTIIYKLFQEAGVDIPKNIAGIMLSAILSDTLLFKSPTTTPLDIEVGNKLAVIAKQDIQDYGYKMFKATSSVQGLTIADIVNYDMKTYKLGGDGVAVGQIITMDFDDIARKEDELVKYLDDMCTTSFKMGLLFVTDVIRNGSYVFFNNKAKDFLEDAYGISNLEQGAYFDGFVSRKKQMLPPLIELAERRS